MIDAIKCLAVINEAYVDFFSVFQLSLHYPSHVSNVISCSSCFPESCLIVWKFSFNCALHSLVYYRISPSTSRFKNKSKSNFWGKNVSKMVGSNISRTRNSAKIRDPNDAKFHRSAHYTVESLVPQSTISPDMLVKYPKL